MLLKREIEKASQLVRPINSYSKSCYIVFDMDECIGSVHGYSILLDMVYSGYQNGLVAKKDYLEYYQFMFTDLLDNYNYYGFFRPNIIDIFTLIFYYKLLLKNSGIELVCLIYTNNGLEPLVEMVKQLINKIVGYTIVDDYVWRNSSCKRDIDPISKMIKRLEHLKICINPNITTDNTLFFDNDNYMFLMNELGNNYIKVNNYHYYNSIHLYNYYNNHIRFLLVNRCYSNIFLNIDNFRQNLEVYISQLVKGNNVEYVNDSFTLVIPSIINFIGKRPNGNKYLMNYLATTYLKI